MKITVKVDNRSFVVEVGDLNAKPVVALVDGERFEVWPEDIQRVEVSPPTEPVEVSGEASMASPAAEKTPLPPLPGQAAAETGSPNIVQSPLPGVVESIAVDPGSQVSTGDVLCVIEAMKMKNTIRASRAGTVKAIKVAIGQHVRHGDALVEFAG